MSSPRWTPPSAPASPSPSPRWPDTPGSAAGSSTTTPNYAPRPNGAPPKPPTAPPARSPPAPRVTAASLRADLANAKATNHRQHTELEALRRRLGQILGRDALAELGGNTDAGPTAAQLADLEHALSEAKEQLAQRDQELTAARQINRELIARLNRERTQPRPRT